MDTDRIVERQLSIGCVGSIAFQTQLVHRLTSVISATRTTNIKDTCCHRTTRSPWRVPINWSFFTLATVARCRHLGRSIRRFDLSA